jgi:hypothetical protein
MSYRFHGRLLPSIALCLIFFSHLGWSQPVLKYKENESPTWQETVEHFSYLDKKYPQAKLIEAGITDVGKPLHLFIIDGHRDFDPAKSKKRGKSILLINNAIHPGEPCGIDASILLAKQLLENGKQSEELLENLTLLIVPILNVDGALNRSPYNRTNQEGPLEQGFRANAQNMDLNRDFAKLDTENARSLVRIIRKWDPDVFVDTHTSNGSDYPYVLTLISTERNKLNPVLSDYLCNQMIHELYFRMFNTPYPMVPYVENIDRSPERGIASFMDFPRYTTGFASLFNILGFTTEAHMLKPYAERVDATYTFLQTIAAYTSQFAGEIRELRRKASELSLEPRTHILDWRLDTSRYETILFKGYEMRYRISEVTGLETYYFDRSSGWNREIPYYTSYIPVDSVESPEAYLVPQAWHEVIERLKISGIEMHPIPKDTLIMAEVYYIESYSTSTTPYNGRYYHYNTRTRAEWQEIAFHKGDYLIPFKQPGSEYLVQMLEPRARDSFFNWNFFDAILSRKEYFSAYIFDEKAQELLDKNAALREEFELKRKQDEAFRNNAYEQLRFIYEHSEYAEKTFMRYPVVRISD